MDTHEAALVLDAGDALLVIDVQRDFLPGGALGVPHGDEVVPVINRWAQRFAAAGLPVFATRDWHPSDHCSFRPAGPWPPHCVAGTPGAELAPDLRLPADAVIVDKAREREHDSYSGFGGTVLADRLRDAGVQRVFVAGLATDYCVLRTVEDARALGLSVVLLTQAVRAVDVHPGDGDAALASMRAMGARIVQPA